MKKFKGMMTSLSPHWATPKWLYDELNKEFDFNDDPCPLHAKEDGLNRNWGTKTYVNPPYGRGIYAWVEKCFTEALNGKLIVALLPARTDTKWFNKFIIPYNCNYEDYQMAWAAGLIDGEGCIFIKKDNPSIISKHRSPIHSLGIKVSMTDRETVFRLKNLFQCGHITEYKKDNPKWKDGVSWTCRSEDAKKVLHKIYKYSVTKKHEIFEAIKFSLLPKGKSGKRLIDKDLLLKREKAYRTLRELKINKEQHSVVNTEIRFIKGRLKFGDAKNSAPFPSCIVIFRGDK